MLVDTHAHLTSPKFDEDREEALRRALDAGVGAVIVPGTDLDDSRAAVALAERHAPVYACVGYHPHDARKADDAGLAAIEELSRHPKVVAIGEIGLDFYYDFSPRDVQERVFRAQLAMAVRRDLPVVIHTRDSVEPTVAMVTETVEASPAWRSSRLGPHARHAAPRGVFHCFMGTLDTAWRLAGLGFAVSQGGVATFKNPGNAARLVAGVSLEQLLLETDSPYLAPAPHRGRRNEPAYLPLVAEAVAALRRMSVEDVVRATGYNAHRVFGVGPAAAPVFTYRLRNALYVNLTNRCNANCVFCDRSGEAAIAGHNLGITREPTAEEVLREIGDPRTHDEVVFCGYGEPTIRLDVLKEVAAAVKAQGGRTRLNTDGHGSVINHRNIVPELVGLIDAVSVSLNTADPVQYGDMMQIDAARFFPAMVEFTREALRLLPRVVMTVVDLPGVDKERARRFAEEVGAQFHVRPYF